LRARGSSAPECKIVALSATNDGEAIGFAELEIFLEFARTQHLGRTAEALGRSVSSIQRAVRALEIRLGVPLVERDGRRVRLLHAGRVLADEAARVVRARSDAVGAVRAASGSRTPVRLGHMFSLGPTLVPRIAAAVLAGDPAARITLRHGQTNALVTAVLAGELDAVLVSPLPLAADLVSTPVFSEGVLLAVAAGDPLAARESVALAEVRDRPFVALSEGSGSRYDMMQACARAGFAPAIAIEAGDMYTLEGIVGAGLGVAVVPESMRGHPQPSVARIPLREAVPTRRQIGLVYVRGSETRPAVSALLRATSRIMPNGAAPTAVGKRRR
jgi:LysR family transcriptional regulator, transcription activator of glutamate synthase operon